MSSFVIVHGAWGGGWEWSPVAQLLRARGHAVWTPTLTGLGDRSHVGRSARIGLATHVDDIVAGVEFEELHDVVLVAASYGGMPVTGAADRIADRVGLVVYVDALVPTAGDAAAAMLPGSFVDEVRAGLLREGEHWRIPIPPYLRDALVPTGSVDVTTRAAYLARLRDHPAATFVDPVVSTREVERLPRVFVRCTASTLTDAVGSDPIAVCASRAREAGWPYRELRAPHDPQLFAPSETAALLDDLAATYARP